MIHLNVEDAEVDLSLRRRGQDALDMGLGFVFGIMLQRAFVTELLWWNWALLVLVVAINFVHTSYVKGAERTLKEAILRRDEYRRERWEELHEQELAAYRETLAQQLKELNGYRRRFN